jgi:spore coat-associated protein N
MSRLSTITRNPKRKVAGLTVALAALGVAVGSGASFTSSSSDDSAAFTAGLLHHDTSTSGDSMDATATVDKILPGDGTDLLDANGDPAAEGPDTTAAVGDFHGTLTVTNDGNVPAHYTADTSSTGAAYDETDPGALDVCPVTCLALDNALMLYVTSTDSDPAGNDGVEEYDGTVAGFNGAGLAAFDLEPGDSRTYDAYFWLPDGTDDNYQGGTASIGIDVDGAQQ